MEKLLIVEDSEDIRKQLKWGLGKECHLLIAENAESALSLYQKHKPKVVTLDLGLPPSEDTSEEGFKCLKSMLSANPNGKIIVVTAHDDRENALRAIEMGACDYYQKPLDLRELKVIVKRVFHLSDLEEENRELQASLRREHEFWGMYGQCPEMMEIFSTTRKLATADVPVLVMGESGTGKELVARAIHSLSLRKEGPFITINCGAIPEHLLESELFGHEKGAFTGAIARVQGKVEYANGGVLFLDEIGELPPGLQVKLLRFLQEKLIQRVGGRENIAIDARVIAATNIDMEKAIQEGMFREDLFYRIGVVSMNLPPLRERGDDVLFLAKIFLARFGQEFNKKNISFSKEAAEALCRYSWPGNVRELENKIQRAVIMAADTTIEPHDLALTDIPTWRQKPHDEGRSLKEARKSLEKTMLQSALEKCSNNLALAAEDLGISRPTLYGLLKKHKLIHSSD
jgi:two-component system NtrC family response regulator